MSEKMQIRDRRTVRRFFIDNIILDEYGKKLGPYGIAVYTALCRFANLEDQTCYPSVATIAKRTGMSENKARKCIHELEEMGLISIQPRCCNGSPTSNLYTILDPPSRVPHSVEGGTPQRGGGVPHSVEGGTPQRGGEQSSCNNQQQQQQQRPAAAAAPGGDEENPTKNHEQDAQDVQEAVEALTNAGFQPRSDAQAYARRDPEAARAWAIYARNQNLSGGYIRKRLDAGDPPPEPEKQKADEWAGRVFEW
jgi:hypothetical protein